MLGLLRQLFATRAGAEVTASRSSNREASAVPDLRPLVLARFEKPRTLARAAPGLPEKMVAPIVQDLLQSGDVVLLGLADQLTAARTVPQLKDMLRERDLQVSGAKAALVQRLVDAGATLPAADAVYGCSPAGRAKAEVWQAQRGAALDAAAHEALELLQARQVGPAIAKVREVREAWPSMEEIAVRFNPLALSETSDQLKARVRTALSAAPGILRDVSAEDLKRLQLAVAIWEAGLPSPGIDLAMVGYVGGSRFAPDVARRLIHASMVNACNLARSRSIGIIEGTLSFVNPCPACAQFQGKTFRLDAMPELPNPDCQAAGCISIVRPKLPALD